jgi:two-component sensor histidine kinase
VISRAVGALLRYARLPAGLRGRLATLLVVSAIPVLALATVFAWRNFDMVADRALERATLIRATSLARHEAVLANTRRLLINLAAVPEAVNPSTCAGELAKILALQPRRFEAIAQLDTTGRAACFVATPDARPEFAAGGVGATGWFRSLKTGASILLAGSGAGPPGERMVVAAPWRDTPAGRRVFVAELVVDWVGQPETAGARLSPAWLIDSTGRMAAVSRADPSALPDPTVLSGLLSSGDAPAFATARDGRSYAYATAALDDDLRLLVATPAAADIARAHRALVSRITGLGVMLLIGIGAVARGANRGVVEPIVWLTQAVTAWRAGGHFDPGPASGLPREVRDLWDTFVLATDTLGEREQQLRRAVEQQELLMQEIHHRVKNNLQIIASLMNLQASRIRLPEAKREFQAARDRIRALATLHRHLYAHGDLHTINMRSFLNELCDQLLQAIGESPSGRIELRIEAPALQMSSDQAVPMALIVTEAVSNAAKYAFPQGRAGHIQVRLTTEGNAARLVIEDDGVGIPAGPAQTETGVRDGIGMHLIRGFARQLGGTLVVTQDHGTRYTLDLLIVRERDTEAVAELAQLG